MRSALFAFLLLFSLNIFATSTDTDEEHLFVVSGVVINSGTSKKIEKFVEMIEKKSGYKLKPFYVNSYDRLSETLRNNPDALAWTCGSVYVQDHIQDRQQLVAIPLFNNMPTYSSYIVARKDDTRKKLTEFKAASFAYSDIRSNSAYLSFGILLKKRGFDIKDFFRVKVHTGTHERSIESVYKGVADIAAIDEYIWVEYLKTQPYLSKGLHVIEKNGPFPFTPIVAGSGVNRQTLQKVQNSLINMNKTELQNFKNDFNMDGFILKDSSFYEPIKQMLTEISE